MEIGRTDFCHHSGFRYRDMELDDGIMIAVAHAECRYRRPARYDDEILIRTSLIDLRRRTMTFSYEISNAVTGEGLADGRTVHVAIGRDGKPRAIPSRQFRLLSGFLPSPPA
jgi:acyl-CoA thioester hydrolase